MDIGNIPWDKLKQVTDVLVNITLIVAAVVAVIKFRLFNILGHRWRSELVCTHRNMQDGSTQFSADYILHNTGSRTLRVKRVLLQLVPAKANAGLLEPDESHVLAERQLVPKQPGVEGAFWIEGGERTIFSLYCHFTTMPENVFVFCSFELEHRRPPSPFRELYSTNPLGGTMVKGTPSQLTVSPNPPPLQPQEAPDGRSANMPLQPTR